MRKDCYPGSDSLGGTDCRKSRLIGINSVLLSHRTFKPRFRIWKHPDEPVVVLSRRWEYTYSQHEMLWMHCDYSACGSSNDSV
jgi:hypothetical protein